MAAPMLLLLSWSALDVLRAPLLISSTERDAGAERRRQRQRRRQLKALAVPQLLLAGLATTSFHVQIITRIASSCPLMYIWLAGKIVAGPATTAGSAAVTSGTAAGKINDKSKQPQNQEVEYAVDRDFMVTIPGRRAKVHFSNLVVRFMVMYSVVQAGLFASFLPPA